MFGVHRLLDKPRHPAGREDRESALLSLRLAPCVQVPDLEGQLRGLLEQVPRGCVTTPGALARALGDPRAATWIGHYLLDHVHPRDCACHRVVRAGGVLGPFIGGEARAKAALLRSEGVRVVQGRIDLERCGYDQFRGPQPLLELKTWQASIRDCVRLRAWRAVPRWIGAVDVSYFAPNQGVAAHVLYDIRKRRLVASRTIQREVCFPYISSYLAFRELPLLLDLMQEVSRSRELGELTLVDGGGILHPRRAGIASHLGVITGLPTIGITKKLLVGHISSIPKECGKPVDVLIDGASLGLAFLPTARARNPLYASPGHEVDLGLARRLIPRVTLGHRLPEPIYFADQISRARARNAASGPVGRGIP